MARRNLIAERDRAAAHVDGVTKARSELLSQKIKKLQEVRIALVPHQLSAEVITAVAQAASGHFHAEQRRLLEDPELDGEDLWELLDGIEYTQCGDKAVEAARKLGITDQAVLELLYDFGMRMADFCFASEEQTMDI